MEGKCLSVAVLLSEPEESDSLCLFEDGGGGRRRGTWGAGLDSGCVSGFALLGEVRFDASSRSRACSCTTTSATSVVSSATCGASSLTDPSPEETGDGDTKESLPSFCSSSSLSSSPSNLPDPPSSSSSSSSSLSSDSPKPSCARALAIFLR